jgi:high-affinity iron transporter
VARIDKLLAGAAEKLAAGNLSPGAAFTSSLIILLREGLEAILLVAAIVAFVRKTGRAGALRYVHAGWILAVVLGLATWALANYAMDISGANRELTEGITALFAAAMLLYVGYWLHGKTQAQAWTAFLRDTVGQALERKTLWALVGVSFLAVYREIFEVILFYEALWVQAGDAGRHAVWGGIAAAGLLLGAAGWGIFRYSLRLPLGPFFSSMSLLLALLAVVFSGQGVAALQEAGVVSASHFGSLSLPLLGIHPTAETLGAQLAAMAIVGIGMYASRRGTTPAAQRQS